MNMRASHHRLVVLCTAVVGLALATSAPAAAVTRLPVPEVLEVGGGPASVEVTCCHGELPGPLETTVRVTINEEGVRVTINEEGVRVTINDEGLPAAKTPKK